MQKTKDEKRPRIILVFVFAFLIALRLILHSFEQLAIVITMVNAIALLIVVFDVAEKLKKSILLQMENKMASKNIASREKRTFTIRFYAILIVASAIFSAVYIVFWNGNLGNDIVSIIALMISFLDDEIIAFGTFLYEVLDL